MGAIALERRHLFTVMDWHRMGEMGLFAPEYHGELIEGEIADMAPIGPTHNGCLIWLNRFFTSRLGMEIDLSIQGPLQLGDFSEPQPDLLLLKPCPDSYRSHHPTPADTLLVIEVADSSSRFDREVKAPLYARYGISEYWLVDLHAQAVEVFRVPQPGGYQERFVIGRGQGLRPGAFPDLEVRIDELLG